MPALKYDIFGLIAAAAWPAPSSPKIEPIYATQLSRFSAIQHPSNLDDTSEILSYWSQVSLYNLLLIYLGVPLILEVGKEFLRIPYQHPLYFTVFNIYFCCIRVHSIIGLRPQTTWSYINYALCDSGDMCTCFVDSNVTSSGLDNRDLLLILYGSVHVNVYPRDLNSDQ